MEYGGPERRRSPRVPITARVKLLDKKHMDYFFTRDISICGIGLISKDPIKTGKSVEMEIAISGVDKFVKVIGKVVRKIESEPAGFGVDFTRFAPYSKVRLSKALKKLK